MAEVVLPSVTTRMAALVECLCDTVSPGVCYCGPFFGDSAPFDFCGDCDGDVCGQAWVRLVQVYPSSSFPIPDVSATCQAPLAYEWEVGVVRCAPTMSEDGTPPSRDENIAATVQQYADMLAMRQAIACCFGRDFDYVLGPYTPSPSIGGCVGGVWQVFSR